MKKRTRKPVKANSWADHYTQKAKNENYPARSVYKLMEIQKKFRIVKSGDRVLDLGCAPGSWLMYAAEVCGPEGKAIGVDLKAVEIRLPENALAVTGDIFDPELDRLIGAEGGFSVVLSDMAPATTGRKDIDALRSFELCRAALSKACSVLRVGGNFVCKIFQGSEFKQFENDVRSAFQGCRIFKPASCRKSSKEIYIIGTNKK